MSEKFIEAIKQFIFPDVDITNPTVWVGLSDVDKLMLSTIIKILRELVPDSAVQVNKKLLADIFNVVTKYIDVLSRINPMLGKSIAGVSIDNIRDNLIQVQSQFKARHSKKEPQALLVETPGEKQEETEKSSEVLTAQIDPVPENGDGEISALDGRAQLEQFIQGLSHISEAIIDDSTRSSMQIASIPEMGDEGIGDLDLCGQSVRFIQKLSPVGKVIHNLIRPWIGYLIGEHEPLEESTLGPNSKIFYNLICSSQAEASGDEIMLPAERKQVIGLLTNMLTWLYVEGLRMPEGSGVDVIEEVVKNKTLEVLGRMKDKSVAYWKSQMEDNGALVSEAWFNDLIEAIENPQLFWDAKLQLGPEKLNTELDLRLQANDEFAVNQYRKEHQNADKWPKTAKEVKYFEALEQLEETINRWERKSSLSDTSISEILEDIGRNINSYNCFAQCVEEDIKNKLTLGNSPFLRLFDYLLKDYIAPKQGGLWMHQGVGNFHYQKKPDELLVLYADASHIKCYSQQVVNVLDEMLEGIPVLSKLVEENSQNLNELEQYLRQSLKAILDKLQQHTDLFSSAPTEITEGIRNFDANMEKLHDDLQKIRRNFNEAFNNILNSLLKLNKSFLVRYDASEYQKELNGLHDFLKPFIDHPCLIHEAAYINKYLAILTGNLHNFQRVLGLCDSVKAVVEDHFAKIEIQNLLKDNPGFLLYKYKDRFQGDWYVDGNLVTRSVDMLRYVLIEKELASRPPKYSLSDIEIIFKAGCYSNVALFEQCLNSNASTISSSELRFSADQQKWISSQVASKKELLLVRSDDFLKEAAAILEKVNKELKDLLAPYVRENFPTFVKKLSDCRLAMLEKPDKDKGENMNPMLGIGFFGPLFTPRISKATDKDTIYLGFSYSVRSNPDNAKVFLLCLESLLLSKLYEKKMFRPSVKVIMAHSEADQNIHHYIAERVIEHIFQNGDSVHPDILQQIIKSLYLDIKDSFDNAVKIIVSNINMKLTKKSAEIEKLPGISLSWQAQIKVIEGILKLINEENNLLLRHKVFQGLFDKLKNWHDMGVGIRDLSSGSFKLLEGEYEELLTIVGRKKSSCVEAMISKYSKGVEIVPIAFQRDPKIGSDIDSDDILRLGEDPISFKVGDHLYYVMSPCVQHCQFFSAAHRFWGELHNGISVQDLQRAAEIHGKRGIEPIDYSKSVVKHTDHSGVALPSAAADGGVSLPSPSDGASSRCSASSSSSGTQSSRSISSGAPSSSSVHEQAAPENGETSGSFQNGSSGTSTAMLPFSFFPSPSAPKPESSSPQARDSFFNAIAIGIGEGVGRACVQNLVIDNIMGNEKLREEASALFQCKAKLIEKKDCFELINSTLLLTEKGIKLVAKAIHLRIVIFSGTDKSEYSERGYTDTIFVKFDAGDYSPMTKNGAEAIGTKASKTGL